jgi:hypothetical protein
MDVPQNAAVPRAGSTLAARQVVQSMIEHVKTMRPAVAQIARPGAPEASGRRRPKIAASEIRHGDRALARPPDAGIGGRFPV